MAECKHVESIPEDRYRDLGRSKHKHEESFANQDAYGKTLELKNQICSLGHSAGRERKAEEVLPGHQVGPARSKDSLGHM